MSDTPRPIVDAVVRCAFDRCPTGTAETVVGAVVDQLCAAADIDITLLDAIEYPLTEALEALRAHGVTCADIGIRGNLLSVAVGLERPVEDPSELLGASAEIVTSFFDVRTDDRPARFSLSGSLT